VFNISCAKRDDKRQKIFVEWGRKKVEENKYFTPRNVLICLGRSGVMNYVRK